MSNVLYIAIDSKFCMKLSRTSINQGANKDNNDMRHFFIGKLRMHPMGLEPTTSSSTREEVPFELELIEMTISPLK